MTTGMQYLHRQTSDYNPTHPFNRVPPSLHIPHLYLTRPSIGGRSTLYLVQILQQIAPLKVRIRVHNRIQLRGGPQRLLLDLMGEKDR